MNQFKFFLLILLFTTQALATNAENREKSQGTALLASQIVEGSASLFTHKDIIVTAVKQSGNTTYITMKTADQHTTATIKLPSQLPQHLSLAAGQAINVTSNAGGYVLYAAGQLFAILPYEFGKTLRG